MLSQIVRPMVRTQIRLLAGSHATRSTLITTIAQWLEFLGVEARVTQLNANSNQICVSLTVGKPDACDPQDWQQILNKLALNQAGDSASSSAIPTMTPQQQSRLQRLLAYVIQVGNPDHVPAWEVIAPHLRSLDFDETMLLGIRSALKVPQSLDHLMEDLDPDVAAIALPKAVSIALLDRQVNPHEDKALSLLLEAMKQPVP